MTFRSILFERAGDGGESIAAEAPESFIDLNLDQVVEAITAGKQEYDLKPFFYTPLHDTRAIEYRHQIMRDLEGRAVLESVRAFAQNMRGMREHLAQADKLRYTYQKERWFLDAVRIYCGAVSDLVEQLSAEDLRSRGLLAFRTYLTEYANSGAFTSLQAQTKSLLADLSAIRYCLIIQGNTVRIRRYEGESDYSAEVEATFEKFKQGAVKDYRAEFHSWPDMNHVEEQILGFVARLHPEVFSRLDHFCAANAGYLDHTIGVFDREVQFYVAYLDYLAAFKRFGLSFCYPQVSDRSKDVSDRDVFDLALAYKLIGQNAPVVCNDFYLKGNERIFVVSGPNQGGKTTFARTFGQLHYMAALGLLVPGREARLFLFDRLFTHFEREEDLNNLRGKLEDDLVRIHDVLSRATPNSIIIMNEIFTSTTLQDAIFLAQEVMERIIELDALCVCVTFIDELASMGEKTVSMVSTVVPENPTLRTYKIVRRPANGLSYALSIAEKYGLTYDRLKERIAA